MNRVKLRQWCGEGVPYDVAQLTEYCRDYTAVARCAFNTSLSLAKRKSLSVKEKLAIIYALNDGTKNSSMHMKMASHLRKGFACVRKPTFIALMEWFRGQNFET
ncbi:hypothetical protein T07_10261 [Trichinella nelsoni]|uniref:Uncharacterized protein n=1 Tax=Trichinella nelsoni TaxID=6336 RepID=A0A0V0RH18_9BILA|nr:hypothetical protein T07_10261 [Trichinella nelsoni]